jgi:hypothetical protein
LRITPARISLEELDSALRQRGQEVQRVELVDERVGKLDEHLGQSLFTGHDDDLRPV